MGIAKPSVVVRAMPWREKILKKNIMKFPSYSVAIRTLGTAGEKYRQELESILRQTVPPEKIVVYIAEGYPLPSETVGVEQYVYCKKGMVAQRAMDFKEIDSEFILLLDDDMLLADDTVEILLKALMDDGADTIAANLFPNHQWGFKAKLYMAYLGTFPRCDDGWAMKLLPNVGYTYNNSPKKDYLPTETFAGGCVLIRKTALLGIHFEEELWMDKFRYSLGDDAVFSYKLLTCGYKSLMHYNCKITHLDGGSGARRGNLIADMEANACLTATWGRLVYQASQGWRRVYCTLFYTFFFVLDMVRFTVKSLVFKQPWMVWKRLKLMKDTIRFIHSEEFKSLPPTDAHKKH